VTRDFDDVISDFLADEGRRANVAAPSLDQAVGRLAPRLAPRVRHDSRRMLLILAAALLLAAALGSAIAVGTRLLQPDPLPAVQLNVIRQVIDAVNDRDPGTLASSFVPDGTLEIPAVDARAGREGDVLVSDGHRPDIRWIRLVEPWGLEARLGSCHPQRDSVISCEVVTAWHVLQLEIGEEWIFEFDGERISRLRMVRVDPDPSNRVLPLGLVDLEGWETWLRETHPEQAEHLLPTGPDAFGWWYFRFGIGADPPEIGASIREYIRSTSDEPVPSASMLPDLGLPGARASAAGEYGWTGAFLGTRAGMHNVGHSTGPEDGQTQLFFLIWNDCFRFGTDAEPESVTVAGLEGLYVEPYEDPRVMFMPGPRGAETTGAYALAVGDRTLCVYLTWDPDSPQDEVEAARQVVESIRAQPFGQSGIRINFTLPAGWDTG
jgi:hypothetical protein